MTSQEAVEAIPAEDSVTYWHGGVPGLRAGDVLKPEHHRRTHKGCRICEARANGQHPGIDPPSAEKAVYITTHRPYAQFYASLWGRGDLYKVKPVGEVRQSSEDRFPTFLCALAVVVGVSQRGVLLTPHQRRELRREWGIRDWLAGDDSAAHYLFT